jgi:hypothetical protein
MKWTALLFLFASLCHAQEFSTAQAARLVIGQKPFTAASPGTSDVVLGSATGVAYAADTLVVADGNNLGGTPLNHRVLIYRNVRSFVPDRKAAFAQTDTRCPACVGQATTVLGQPDFTTNAQNPTAQNTLRNPLGVAYNGNILAVSDTDNNRVLIWKSLPAVNQQPADLVIGQKDFKGNMPGRSASGLRGPQGLYLTPNNELWVADSGNSRVLYYGVVTQNGQEAKLVLGQPDLNTNQQQGKYPEYVVKGDSMLGPTSVTSDGARLIVADLGLNRVLIWNTIPTRNGQPADVVLGQPDFTSPELKTDGTPTTHKLCASNGTDAKGNPTYPERCEKTLDAPRAVLTDGKRLFVADSGNDRILIWNEIPRENGQAADTVLGQWDFLLNQASDTGEPRRVSATDSFKTPVGLAWDGENLYVADTYNRRVLVYTPADFSLPITAVRNAASPKTFASGTVTLGGTIDKDYELTIKIGNENVKKPDGTTADPKSYTIKTVAKETLSDLIDRFVASINAGAGDPYVIATPNKAFNAIILTAREEDSAGNAVTLETAVSTDSKVTLTASGTKLTGGQDPSLIAPYAIVSILGDNLSDQTMAVDDLTKPLPLEMGGVQFFVDGVQVPLLAVSPNRVVAQIPVQVSGSTSASGVLRVKRRDGAITVATAVAIRLIEYNPSVYTADSLQPSPGLAYHSSSQATSTVSVDGTANAGDIATIKIRDRAYSYQVQATDTLKVIRDNLIALINASDPEVEAYAAGPFQRIRLRAKVPGPAGNGIPISASATTDAQVIMTALNTELCCANEAGAPVTEDNPAVPGETIVVLASGLGVVMPEAARDAMNNGQPYYGPELNDAAEFVSSLAGGKTANVLFAGLRRGAVGIYEVHLELNPDLETNPKTQVTIAQSYQVSNVFTIPVLSKKEGK